MWGRLLAMLTGANVLTILPLPPSISSIRPAWVLICLLYVQTYLPKYFHVLLVLFLGLCLDALLSTPMGEHAFALLVTTWLMVGKTHRFAFFSIAQQMLGVGLACGCYQTILFIIDASFGHTTALYTIIGVAFSSMMFWVILPILLGMQGVKNVR